MQPEYTRPNSTAWTSVEIKTLREHAHLGLVAVALLLGRSEHSVQSAAKRYRISLRRVGERRGKILGQPARGRWTDQTADSARLAAIRSDVLDGSVSIPELERRIRDRIYGPAKPLCPSCGQREQEKATTGLCEPCHLRELARAHRDEIDRRAARRELAQARQEKHRALENS